MNRPPRVLVVAGRDPSGAGVDADRDALSSLALSADFVVTAETDQDDRGVRSMGARDPAQWGSEADERAARGISALKLGLLPGTAHVARAARLVARLPGGTHVVLDPVIAASSGARFLDTAGVEALRGELLGAGVIVTPNLPEAAELARVPLAELARDPAARIDAARVLLGLGAAGVVLKGGHGHENPVRDLVLVPGFRPVWSEHPRTPGGGIRGSGCRFASRLAGELALGTPLDRAAQAAGEFVAGRIAERARSSG
jgi:hydroxymethylpyrimidine/phosphomethylpyrimidine kinase